MYFSRLRVFSFPYHQIKSNAVRALGNISRSVKCTIELETTGDYGKGCQRDVSISYHPASLRDSRWLERVVQAFISCVTTGNVKVSIITILSSKIIFN